MIVSFAFLMMMRDIKFWWNLEMGSFLMLQVYNCILNDVLNFSVFCVMKANM